MAKKIDTPFDTIHFINHSHVDQTWWNSPEKCLEQNEKIITELLAIASAEQDFKFSYEITAGLMQYLMKYPARKDEINNLLQQRRLDVGGLFVSANDDVCSPEGIVRNFIFGAGWLRQTFGYFPKVTKQFDTPGHPLQLPQLVRNAGMSALVITRGPQGCFYWAGPDGTELLTLSVPYNWSYWRRLGVDYAETEKNLPRELGRAKDKYPGPDLVIPDGDDMTLPNAGLVGICAEWNRNYERPKLQLATFDEIADMYGRRRFPRRSGDMPNLWIVIHTLQAQATRDLRALQGTLPAVELLCSILSIERGDFKQYPAAVIDSLWRNSLLAADHNWGGKDETRHGTEGDEHKQALITKSLRECRAMTENVFVGFSKLLLTQEPALGMPILVMNPCSWKRTDVVPLELNCSVTGLEGIEVVDADNNPVPAGFAIVERHKDGSIYRANGEMLGRDIPSCGYATFYIKPLLKRKDEDIISAENVRTIENDFYRVTVAADGSRIESLYDKELGEEFAVLAKTSVGPIEFEFGTFELFGVGLRLTVPDQSYFENPENEGSGESVEPTGEIFRAADAAARVSAVSRGNVSKALVVEGDFAGSKRVQRVVLYDDLKRIDLHVDLEWAGKSNVAVYMEMPNALMDGQKHIDVPFAVHTDGNELSDFWLDENLPVKFKIRGVQDWLCFEEKGLGLAIATRWPVVDFTATPAFPLLWTNDNSGFFFGERYRQAGSHRFSFSLTSYKGSWLENNIHRWGKQWARQILTFFADAAPTDARRSYFSIDASNVILTSFKKAQNENALVVRLYETAGKITDTEVSLPSSVREVFESNILETESRKLSSRASAVRLRFRPFEIKTLKLSL